MNWVGGARTRVKTKDSKKKQQEFFEKKRFETKHSSCKTESNDDKKDQLSQDLIFLRTLMNENANKTKKAPPSVVHINFEKPRSSHSFVSRHTKVELPESPEIKPSLNICTSDIDCHEDELEPQLETHLDRSTDGNERAVIFERTYDSFSNYTETEEDIDDHSESLSSSQYDDSPQSSSHEIQTVLSLEDDRSPKTKMPRLQWSSPDIDRQETFVRVVDVKTQTKIPQVYNVATQT